MKKTFKTFIISVAAIAAVIACQKEFEAGDLRPAGMRGKINVDIEAILGELTSADGTKATLDPVMRLHWENGDTVFVYGTVLDNPKKLGFLLVETTESGLTAKLKTDEDHPIIEPNEGSDVYFFYWSGADTLMSLVDGHKLTFNLAKQDTLTFMAFGKLKYEGEGSLTGKAVPFNFATSLMRVAVSGLNPDNKPVDSVAVSGLDTLLRFDLMNGTYSSSNKGHIHMGDGEHDVKNFSKKGGQGIFYIGVVAGNANSDRRISIKQDSRLFGSKFTDTQIETGKCYTTVAALTEQTGSGGSINGHNYVYIAGKKWALQNVYFNDTAGDEPFPKSDYVEVETLKETLKIGDFFQWGAYSGYINPYYLDNGDPGTSDSPVLYYPEADLYNDDISGKRKNNSDYERYLFEISNSPFYKDGVYTHYSASDGMKTLAPEHDVANIRMGGTWRMPTKEDFQALKDSTVWVWSAVDSAFAICPAGYRNHPGGTVIQTPTDDITRTHLKNYVGHNALMILPAAGYFSEKTHKFNEGDIIDGCYWTSTLDENNNAKAYYLKISGSNSLSENDEPTLTVSVAETKDRCLGLSVRAVSD